MAQINARDWIFQINTTGSTYVSIAGIESFTLSPSEGEATTETTTFDSAGVAESQVMQRGASLSVEGKLVRTAATVQDPGQVAVNALGVLVGDASVGKIRFRHTADTSWITWNAWCSLGDNGGGINDKTTWSASFTRSGAAGTATVA